MGADVRILLDILRHPLLVVLVAVAAAAWMTVAVTRYTNDRNRANGTVAAIETQVHDYGALVAAQAAAVGGTTLADPYRTPSDRLVATDQLGWQIYEMLRTSYGHDLLLRWKLFSNAVRTYVALSAPRIDPLGRTRSQLVDFLRKYEVGTRGVNWNVLVHAPIRSAPFRSAYWYLGSHSLLDHPYWIDRELEADVPARLTGVRHFVDLALGR